MIQKPRRTTPPPRSTVAAGKKPDLPIGRVQRIPLEEGRCLQIMHRGSFDGEGPVLDRLHHDVMLARGLTFTVHDTPTRTGTAARPLR